MPPIQISFQTSEADFKRILKDHWKIPIPGGDNNPPPNEGLAKVADAKSRAELVSDYAKIGAFLVNKNRVIQALEPLDHAVRDRLNLADQRDSEAFRQLAQPLQQNLQTLRQNVLATQSNNPADRNAVYGSRGGKSFKNFKLLSGLLDEAEAASHFNGAQTTLAKLHSASVVTGDPSMNTAIAFQNKEPQSGWKAVPPDKPGELPKMNLPKGAPTLTGILTTSFNPILLRNGFHWKDPGADAEVHGEYTHRLQWYAIVHAGGLGLVNDPVQIFKSLGYLFAGVKNDGATIYIWELLFDNFDEDQSANAPGKPFTTDINCFSCPNYLNTYLSKARCPNPAPDSAAVRLPWLNALMCARKNKRAIERQRGEQDKTYLKIHTGQKPVGFGMTTPVEQKQPLGGAIWWPKR